ncbi:tumor necrosis factor alpha-induced protein 2-like isoform X2 [Ctenopharyngodon idella]|uniref:tumor necrosis factor alpha-induced protein 2-like isoform X2 n=1 Tax=Ctenopharyngodon idella TaxID=7959 RepID=UPI0022317C9C|nr:tumor necrosis factor alpha-induced protein 2-like isoform X2 [Ctenopharyngodon idella]
MNCFKYVFSSFLGIESVNYLPVNGGLTEPSDFIKNILICVLKMNEGRMGVERHEEEDLEVVEDIKCDEGLAVRLGKPKAECQKHKLKIPKTNKMKNFLKGKFKRKSKFEAPLTPTALLEVDFDTTEGIADSSVDPEEECQKHKIKISDKMKNVFSMRWQRNTKPCETQSVGLDFIGNLNENHLEAEDRLFGSNEVAKAEDESHEILRLKMAIHDSFNEDNQETLKSALASIFQEGTQGRCWNEVVVDEHPIWSPMKCRQIKTLLKIVVEERMKTAEKRENKADQLSTSLKREVCRMGKQVQKDLLRVVRNLRECYPPEFDICRTYARLYHQTFSTRLQELARSSVDFEDCLYILSWIVDYYPKNILKHKELEEHINNSSLGPLLPEEDLTRLEEQYFSYKENEVRKWLFTALEKEVKKWSDGFEPEIMDGYYFSNLAADVLPLVDITVSDVKALLGSESKAWCLLTQLDSFLTSYKTSLEKLVKRKPKNIPKILSANLVDIHHFRDYVQRPEHLFSEDTRTACLSTLADLKNICHKYFLSRIHTELKPLYRKLWTQAWFAGHCEVVEELMKALEDNMDQFKELKPVCREELLAELHIEVTVEYVRRMMKRKLKLKDKEQQEAAAEFICHDNSKICSVFAKVGSKEEWLCQILPKLSEILRLQDLGSLQLEIATLARDYPDISEQQILAVLNLKTNLSSSDLCSIEVCLSENRSRPNTESSPAFFSKVLVKQDTLCYNSCN